MADRLKPEHVEIVDKIRVLEDEIVTAKQRFKKYHNYYAPEELVKASKRVISFGVGGDVTFEKLMCLDNMSLDVRLFDPTPYTKANRNPILRASGKKYFYNIENGIKLCRKIGNNNLKYKPIGYSPTNGKQKFYYSPQKNVNGHVLRLENQWKSFSAFNPDGSRLSTEVEFQNLRTIMDNLGWESVDILKTDIEGYWYDFANELLKEKIDFKYWVTEIELGLNGSYEENFKQIREISEKMKDKYQIVINRKRLKPMLELGFLKK